MPELKCFLCQGTIVQDRIEKERYVAIYDGCHCTGCGIKFKPNLEELIKLFEAIKEGKD